MNDIRAQNSTADSYCHCSYSMQCCLWVSRMSTAHCCCNLPGEVSMSQMIHFYFALKAVNSRAINSDEANRWVLWKTWRGKDAHLCWNPCRIALKPFICSFFIELLSRLHFNVCLYVCADDRLVSILRHHNFLKELQEVAVQGESPITQSCLCAECAWLNVQMKKAEWTESLSNLSSIEGDQERAKLQRPIDTPTPTTQAPHSADDNVGESSHKLRLTRNSRHVISSQHV